MQEFVVHYEDAPTKGIQVSASSHLAAAKDYALQSPRRGDCSIVVKTQNKSPEERWVYDRVGATYSQRAEIVSQPGQKAEHIASGSRSPNSYSELRVMRLPVWRSAILMFIIMELLAIVGAVIYTLLLLGLYSMFSAINQQNDPALPDSVLINIIASSAASELGGGLIAPVALLIGFPVILPINAGLVLLINCALKLTGGLPIRVRR